MKRVDLKTYLHVVGIIGEDVDLYVDGIDGRAYCGTELTEEGERYFHDCLTKCYVTEGYCIEWDSDDTDDEEGIPSCAYQAWELLSAMAGYCPFDEHEKWFMQD